MFRSGAFVARHVHPTSDVQVQPNGVDLTLASVHEQREPGRIGRDGTEIGDRRSVPPGPTEGAADTTDATDSIDAIDVTPGEVDGEAYYLPPGAYVVGYGETITVPDDHVGFVYPRSSLLRNSCMLNTAVWDAGYRGRGEGLLQVHQDVEVERGARIAQFVLADAAHEGTYDGSYQHENVGR